MGGTKTVPLCRTCHDLVDRIPLSRWPDATYERVLTGDLPTELKLLGMKMIQIVMRSETDEDLDGGASPSQFEAMHADEVKA